VSAASNVTAREHWLKKNFEFARTYAAYVRELDPDTWITVGHTYAWELEETADLVDGRVAVLRSGKKNYFLLKISG
jgi:hypothetical protein